MFGLQRLKTGTPTLSVCGELISSRDVTAVCGIQHCHHNRGAQRGTNLFHKVSNSLLPFRIPFVSCLFTINTARNGCVDALESSTLSLASCDENAGYLTAGPEDENALLCLQLTEYHCYMKLSYIVTFIINRHFDPQREW